MTKVVYHGLLPSTTMSKPSKRNTITKAKRRELWLRFKYCVYCGWEFEEVDHLVPHSLTQDDSIENLVPACRTCNRIAGAKCFESFEDKRAFILRELERKYGNKRIPLWTEPEMKDMGRLLSNVIRKGALVCENDKHRLHIASILIAQGYTPIYAGRKPSTTPDNPQPFCSCKMYGYTGKCPQHG